MSDASQQQIKELVTEVELRIHKDDAERIRRLTEERKEALACAKKLERVSSHLLERIKAIRTALSKAGLAVGDDEVASVQQLAALRDRDDELLCLWIAAFGDKGDEELRALAKERAG